jgi:hypothetical protein
MYLVPDIAFNNLLHVTLSAKTDSLERCIIDVLVQIFIMQLY